MKESRLINKMKKLLAMANDKSSENEAAITMRQLHALLPKHNISMSEVEAGNKVQLSRGVGQTSKAGVL